MPRYFFTTQNGELIRDAEGEDLQDETSAKLEAVRFMGEILKDHPGDLLDHERWRVVVSDGENRELFTVQATLSRCDR